ncbi:MAG: sensor histidine kinase [Mycobacteriales bacterium]
MSHELRTPLNAILGFDQLLELDELTGDQLESVHQISRGGRHLLALMNEVLDITRIETGSLTLSSEPVGVAEVLGETLELIRPLAERARISIEAQVAGSWLVQVDRQRTGIGLALARRLTKPLDLARLVEVVEFHRGGRRQLR